jgi:hypothetical protein
MGIRFNSLNHRLVVEGAKGNPLHIYTLQGNPVNQPLLPKILPHWIFQVNPKVDILLKQAIIP